jgi:integrase
MSCLPFPLGKLGIEGLTGHVPRHTLANHMAYSGHSEEEIRLILAHSNVQTTKIYLLGRDMDFPEVLGL